MQYKYEVLSESEIFNEIMSLPVTTISQLKAGGFIETFMNFRKSEDYGLVSMSVVRIDGHNQYHFVWSL